ncbi:TPA: hypothetical protein N0F65_006067 [Lagenidium giganteum]|uniref:Uncharacterized protein n=1 Tax=Lagenidium giganteum TaxID=4803 RepID=A0AAV2YN52_9STRA|nr:TPA: hypothetical protein N0F65_006067 [Lagenidium giganteum]
MVATPATIARVSAGALKNASVVRALSTAAADSEYSFVNSRRAYRQEVAVLRQGFILEEKRRVEKLQRDAEAQRMKIMKEKAARLEIKRQQQAIRAEEVAREKAIQEEEYRKYFEEKVLVRESRAAEVERRRQVLVDTLRDQSNTWITEENLEDKMSEDLFIYSPKQASSRNAFDPGSVGGTATSWLEKLQRMRPAGAKDDAAAAAETTPEKQE